MRRTKYDISILSCSECKNKFPIPRRLGSRRSKGHIKTVWCPYCKDKKDMIEFRSIDFVY